MMVVIALATLTGALAQDAANALRPRARNEARNAAKVEALTSTPEETEARQENRTDRQDSRQERWNDASPNQKAVTYNATKARHQQKVTRQTNAANAIKSR